MPEPNIPEIERGPRIGVPAGARALRPKATLATPLSPDETAAFQKALDGAPATAEPPKPRPLALVIDDDPDQRRISLRVFARLDFHCLEAANGRQALLAVARHKPDVIVLDLRMPEMDGFEVLRGVRSFLRMKEPLILILTGLADIKDEVCALALGADGFLTKPIDTSRLSAHLAAAARRAKPGNGPP